MHYSSAVWSSYGLFLLTIILLFLRGYWLRNKTFLFLKRWLAKA